MKQILMYGCGAMGGAILQGCLSKGIWKKDEVILKEHNDEASAKKAEAFGVSWSKDGSEAMDADAVIIAVKPDVVPSVLNEIYEYHPKRVISIAAAVPVAFLEENLPKKTQVVRVMPNTPASVGEAFTAITAGKGADKDTIAMAQTIFNALGKSCVVTEKQLDALGALSGAGPAYAFVMIDALADAGVLIGLPRKLAIEAAAQTLLGAGRMVLKTGLHPDELRDAVTSPGGTTIAGIHAMERDGVRGALMDAVDACMKKSDEMSHHER
jgi:pyrroline-5-carboxylate reductase